jgi:hypothetical protein
VLLCPLDVFQSFVKDFTEVAKADTLDLCIDLESTSNRSMEAVDGIIHQVLDKIVLHRLVKEPLTVINFFPGVHQNRLMFNFSSFFFNFLWIFEINLLVIFKLLELLIIFFKPSK